MAYIAPHPHPHTHCMHIHTYTYVHTTHIHTYYKHRMHMFISLKHSHACMHTHIAKPTGMHTHKNATGLLCAVWHRVTFVVTVAARVGEQLVAGGAGVWEKSCSHSLHTNLANSRSQWWPLREVRTWLCGVHDPTNHCLLSYCQCCHVVPTLSALGVYILLYSHVE